MTMKLRASMLRKVMSETANWYGSVTRALRSVACHALQGHVRAVDGDGAEGDAGARGRPEDDVFGVR